jgi:hypothetical protein
LKVLRGPLGRTFLPLAVPAVLLVVVFAWWANSQGYIAVGHVTCTLEGFRDPVPSYQDLVTEYGKRPYCARLVRDETWF